MVPLLQVLKKQQWWIPECLGPRKAVEYVGESPYKETLRQAGSWDYGETEVEWRAQDVEMPDPWDFQQRSCRHGLESAQERGCVCRKGQSWRAMLLTPIGIQMISLWAPNIRHWAIGFGVFLAGAWSSFDVLFPCYATVPSSWNGGVYSVLLGTVTVWVVYFTGTHS